LYFDDGIDALDAIIKERPVFIIIDMFLPRLNCLAILKEIKRKNINASILCYCRKLKLCYGIKAIKEGARGVVDFNSSGDDFLKAIETVQCGKKFIPKDIKRLIDDRDYEMFPEKYRGMTVRQVEIMQMTASGLSNQELAYNLNISVKTVEKHKRNLRDKLGLFSSLEIGMFALREGYVDVGREIW
jgi:DNA-binding NarL/FixJ family response regulator